MGPPSFICRVEETGYVFEFGGTCGVGLGGQSRKGVGYAPSTAARPLVKSVCQQEAGG